MLFKRMSDWRTRWITYGATPYFYFYPNSLDGTDNNNGLLRVSPGISLLRSLSVILWFFFILSIISWGIYSYIWMYYVWIIFLIFICLEWVCVGAFMVYEESEVIKTKKDDSVGDMKPMKSKTVPELKSLKMQL